MILQLLKPFVVLWASLNFIDDLTIVMKVARLIEVGNLNKRNADPDKICDFCDEVMEDVLKGYEGLRAAPCSWICLGTKKCMKMCETIKELSDKSGEFPCVAAGYCVAEDDEQPAFETEISCQKGPLFSCEPKKFCRKKRSKYSLKYTCEVKYVKKFELDLKLLCQSYAMTHRRSYCIHSTDFSLFLCSRNDCQAWYGKVGSHEKNGP